MRSLLALAPLALLACPAPKSAPASALDAPPPPAAWPADDGAAVWLFPRPSEAGCVVERSDGGVVARFATACASWSVARHPESEALLLWMRGAAPVQWTPAGGPQILAPLPPIESETGSIDYVGYTRDGRLVAVVERSLEPTLDDAAQSASVEFEGVEHELDYDSASMFSSLGCSVVLYEGDSWQGSGVGVVVQLYEGMEPSYCRGEKGLPELVFARRSTVSGSIELDPDGSHLDGLEPIEDDLASWSLLKGKDIAIGSFWFEGERFTSPLALRAPDGSWTVRDFGEVGQFMTVSERGHLLLTCSGEQSLVVDRSADNAIAWEGKGRCPVFWPMPDVAE